MKNKPSLQTLGLIIAPLCFTLGCASIMTGTKQEVRFHSNPEGATVFIDNKEIGKTPLRTTLNKSSTGPTIKLAKEGYKPYSFQPKTQINGWFWGNIVIGGLFGSTTDSSTGAMNQYAPDQILVKLFADGSTPLNAATSQTSAQDAWELIVVNYKALLEELTAGSGPFLSSLLKILAIPPAKQGEAVQQIQSYAKTDPTPADLADHVVAAYVPEGEPKSAASKRKK